MIKLSDQIWAFAETALRERKSSEALSRYAERKAFRARRRRNADGLHCDLRAGAAGYRHSG